ncbi:SKP protein 14 [Spatholobus suberectus]|nr:SKP protein 14 [Spatholobus suberectus]
MGEEEAESSKSVTLKPTEGEESKVETLKTTKGEETKKVKVKTADDVSFEVEPSIVKEMETVQSFIDANGADASVVIPLPNVASRHLGRIIEYCSEHCRAAGTGSLKEFDERFLEELSPEELKELLLAANYLDIKILLDFLSNSIADLIENKSPEFVRNFFDIINDYTLEEEARIRDANAWAFEGVDDD